MKKQILILSLLASGTAFAQIPKGSIYGGLSLTVHTEKEETETKSGTTTVTQEPVKTMNWGVMPEVSYFVADNMAIGLGLGFNGYKRTRTTTSGTTTTESSYKSSGPGVNLFARKFWNASDNFYCFGGFGVNWSSGKGEDEVKMTNSSTNTTTTTTVKDKNSSLDVGLNAGLAYNVTDKFTLIGNFGVLSWYSNTYKYNITGDPEGYTQDKYSGINLHIATGMIPFNLGFVYLLNAPK